jgi:HEAT repeat protein
VPLTEEEQDRVRSERVVVYAKLEGLAPVLRAFRDEAAAWARAASDPDADVRIEIRHIFEDLALTVQKVRRLEQSVDYPGLGPAKPAPKSSGSTGQAPPAPGSRVQAAPGGVLGQPTRPAIEAVLPVLPRSTTAAAADQATSLDVPVRTAHPAAAPAPPAADEPILGPPVGGVGPVARPRASAVAFLQQPKTEDLPPPTKLGPPGSQIPAPLRQALEVSRAAMIAGLSDQNARVRLASLDVLETMGAEAAPAIPAMVRSLEDSDLFVRWAAARTLGGLAPRQAESVVPALARLLRPEEDLNVRQAVETALGKFGPDAAEAVPALTRALGRGTMPLRVGAIKALESIGTAAEPALPAIAWRLKDASPQVRAEAARVLGRFGPAAARALPALRLALSDPSQDVRHAASDAILAIDVKR